MALVDIYGLEHLYHIVVNIVCGHVFVTLRDDDSLTQLAYSFCLNVCMCVFEVHVPMGNVFGGN